MAPYKSSKPFKTYFRWLRNIFSEKLSYFEDAANLLKFYQNWPTARASSTSKLRLLGDVTVEGGVHISSQSTILVDKNGKLFIGAGSYLASGTRLEVSAGDSMRIENNVSIERGSTIIGSVEIGSFSMIAPNVFISSHHHIIDGPKDYTFRKIEESLIQPLSEPIKLGKSCWIGFSSLVVPGVELGEKTVVGALSVVFKSFKNGNGVVAGNPAIVIRKLNQK